MGVISILITWFLECREEPIGVNKVQREFRVKWDNYGRGGGRFVKPSFIYIIPYLCTNDRRFVTIISCSPLPL